MERQKSNKFYQKRCVFPDLAHKKGKPDHKHVYIAHSKIVVVQPRNNTFWFPYTDRDIVSVQYSSIEWKIYKDTTIYY